MTPDPTRTKEDLKTTDPSVQAVRISLNLFINFKNFLSRLQFYFIPHFFEIFFFLFDFFQFIIFDVFRIRMKMTFSRIEIFGQLQFHLIQYISSSGLHGRVRMDLTYGENMLHIILKIQKSDTKVSIK